MSLEYIDSPSLMKDHEGIKEESVEDGVCYSTSSVLCKDLPTCSNDHEGMPSDDSDDASELSPA
jgi:hypothetical protein